MTYIFLIWFIYFHILHFTFLFSLFVFVSRSLFSYMDRPGTCIILDKKYNIANSSCHFGSYGSIWTGPYTTIWPLVPWTISYICIYIYHFCILFGFVDWLRTGHMTFYNKRLLYSVMYNMERYCTSLYYIENPYWTRRLRRLVQYGFSIQYGRVQYISLLYTTLYNDLFIIQLKWSIL